MNPQKSLSPLPLKLRKPLFFTNERTLSGRPSTRLRLGMGETGVFMAFASSMRRAVLAGSGLLALAACESMPTAEAPQPAAAVVDRSPRVASEIARGRQALSAGDLSTAQSAFTAALRGSPNDPEPAIGLAETYLALGDLQTAGRLFDLVAGTEAGAGDARLLQGRGLVALQQGQTDEAIGLLQQSVERDPTQWRAWAALGRAYGRQGNARQARTAFGRAEEAAPSPAVVINDLGMLHLEENEPAAALEAFQRALVIDPGNATASANARIARAMLGDYDAAVSGARPDELPDVLNNVGYVAIVNGDFDVADRLLRRAIELSPVYHEAASANLGLLAQAMKGVPVLALSGPASVAASRATADAELSSVADTSGQGAIGRGDPVIPIAPGQPGVPAAVDSWDAGLAGGVAEPVAAPAGDQAIAALPQAPAEAAAGAVMAHGFRWDAPPVSAAATKRKRGARKAVQSDAPPDAGDPRRAAWPGISVPPPEAAVTASGPDGDQMVRGAQQPPAHGGGASGKPRDAATQAVESSEPGLPE